METEQDKRDEDNTFAKEALLCEVGSKLEQAREAQALSKSHVLKELKFNASFLDALEEGRWSEMPGEIYALGFLRQYADLLKLDLSTDIDRIKTNAYELTTPLTYPDAPISPNRTWVIIAALLFIIIVIISNLLTSEKEEKNRVEIKNSALVPEVKVPRSDVTPPVLVHINDSAHQSVNKKVEAIEKDGVAKVERKKAVAHVLRPSSFTFMAVSDDVWLQVYEKVDGQEPILRREALLKIGQRFRLESNAKLLITSGKPTALKVLLDGNVLFATGSLGEEGKVLKLFSLQ